MTSENDADDASVPVELQGAQPNATPAPRALRRVQSWALLLALTASIAAVDQTSKTWVQSDLAAAGGHIPLMVTGAFSLAFTYVRNPGAAWGLFARTDESFRRPFFLLISLAAVTFILYLYARLQPTQSLARIALILVLGGAVGNFIDRLRYSYVVDFIDLRYGDFRWPTFNIADAAISIGVGLLLLDMVLERFRARQMH